MRNDLAICLALASLTTLACSRTPEPVERLRPPASTRSAVPEPAPALEATPGQLAMSPPASEPTPTPPVARRAPPGISVSPDGRRVLLQSSTIDVVKPAAVRSPRSFDPLGYWTDRLENGTPEERLAAAVGLGLSGTKDEAATTPLLTLLDDSDPFARRAAADALGRLGISSSAVVARMELLASDDPDADVRNAATAAIASFAAQAEEQAGTGLTPTVAASPTSTAPSEAAGLAAVAPRSFTDAMQQLGSSDAATRAAAVRQASSFGVLAAPAVEDIVDALRDDSAVVRREAAAALGRIGSSAAAPVGIVRATDGSRALPPSSFGPNGEDAIDGLAALLDDEDAAVRLAAVHALAQIGLPASTAADDLRNAAREDDEVAVREAAARALTAVGDN